MNTQRLMLFGLGLTVLTMVFITLHAEPMEGIFWHLIVIYDLPAGWLMLMTLVFAYWLGSRGGTDCAWVSRVLESIDHQRHTIAIALWAGLCAASLLAYKNHPLSMDEYAAVFQAKVFAAGALHGQFPVELLDNLIPRGFQNQFLMVNRNTGAVFSAYWPGFSLLLTPFMALGIPWACNPLLVAVSFLLVGRIARDLAPGTSLPGWALLFSLASPAFVANGITYYSMPAHLLCNLGFVWLLLSPSPQRLFLAGITGGFALVLHNPFPHTIFAIPWIIWLIRRTDGQKMDLVWLALGYAPVVLLLGIGWSLWQQHILSIGSIAAATSAAKGEAPALLERIVGLTQRLLRVMQWPGESIVYARLGGLTKLWLWASPLLLLLAWQGGRKAHSVPLQLMGASALITFFAYFLIRFDQGHGWGYRYFHSALGMLPILAAFGVQRILNSSAHGHLTHSARAFLMLAMLLSLVAGNTFRLYQMKSFMEGHMAQYPPTNTTQSQIVVHSGRGYYGHDLIQNDPWLRGSPIVLLAPDLMANALVERSFPGSKEIDRNHYGVTFQRPVALPLEP